MSTATGADAPHSPAHPRSRRLLFLRMLVGLVALLLVVRLLLPWLLERAVNRRLGALPNHHGIVGDIDLQLFRGAYRFQNFTIRHRGPDEKPLFSVGTADISIAWRELFRGRVVADITLEAPILSLAPSPESEPASEPGPRPGPDADPPPGGEDWRDLIQDLVPIEITRLEIIEGSLDYSDPSADPPVAVGLQHLGARVEGLANRVAPKGEEHPARAELAAAVEGGGHLYIHARGAVLADPPHFEAEGELEDAHLPAFNTVLRSALGVDVSAGVLNVALEMRAAGGRYEGYVKPLVHGARFTDVGTEPESGPMKTVWEGLVAGATSILTNDNTKNVGTRVPFSGEFGATDVDTWDAFVNLLRNAFIQALREGVDEGFAPEEP